MGGGEGMSPRRFAVVGSPVEHSLSPVLHRTAYELLGISDAVYERHQVRSGELAQFLREGPGRGLQGLSVTMPGKPEAYALGIEADETSRRLGISNTLIRTGQQWRAENHDVHGIVAALRDHGADSPVTGAVLGSGATALSALAALAELGVQRVLLSARSAHKLAPLEEFAATRGVAVDRIPWERHHEVLTAEVAVSALAVDGARAVAEQWRAQSGLAVPGVLLDVLYDPWPAPIADVIQCAGGEVADGLEMLAHQADMQLRSMLAVPAAPVREMLTAARTELTRRRHGAE